MKKFNEFVYTTKLGHFSFLTAFGAIFAIIMGIVAPFISEYSFIVGFLSSFGVIVLAAMIMSIFDDNKNWFNIKHQFNVNDKVKIRSIEWYDQLPTD